MTGDGDLPGYAHLYILNETEVEWDPRKAEHNAAKHGVAFSDAVGALDDPYALTVFDDDSGEARSVTLGTDFTGRLLVVVYTWRGARVRIISARLATRAERRQYAEDDV